MNNKEILRELRDIRTRIDCISKEVSQEDSEKLDKIFIQITCIICNYHGK